ncbi:leucine-rich repeat extensin-like protein 4 [Iris pallida]|uniref:Leucine-rich repeat extensin-like protein 4 n=1 Tax=Iris pallida TaxID=29817 RepID=A0AAX6GGB2_IRIPA|nr:leucine-rich repeat extensin-like protein 4 [Iris pallida]
MQAITTTISMQATTTIISAAVPAAIGRAWPRIRRASRAPPRATARTGAAAAAAFAATRAHACGHARRCRAVAGHTPTWPCPPWPTSSDEPPGSATLLSGATYRRFVRFARRPDVTRAKSRSFWRSVAATSCTIFRRSDRWIGDFFAPSQSRFAGQLRQLISPPPQLRLACYQFRCEAGLCGFSGTSYTYQLFRLSRRIAWRCLLA